MDVVKRVHRAQHGPRRRGAVFVGTVVVLDTNPTENRMQMIGNVARGIDVGRAGPATFVDQDSVVLGDG